MRNRKKFRMILTRDVLQGYLFVLPMFIIFAVFKYYPLIDNIRISMTSWNLMSPNKPFVGLKNYVTIFSDPTFYQILGNTFLYTFWSTSISIVIGFLMAVTLYKSRSKGSDVLKTLFFIPTITTASAISILWLWIFDPDFGLSGQLFHALGMESPRWLLTPGYAIWIVISLTVWRSIGYIMLIYASGLSSISSEIYEAAIIDGANSAQTTMRITIPLLAPTTYFLLLTTFIQAMQVFDIVAVMTGGGPYNSTNVLNLYIYQTAFARFQAGKASTLSVILFLILLLFTVIQRVISTKRGKDYV